MIRRPPRSTLFPYHDALPILLGPEHATKGGTGLAAERLGDCTVTALAVVNAIGEVLAEEDRKSTRLNSSHANISYAVFCLKKKNERSTIPILHYIFIYSIKQT